MKKTLLLFVTIVFFLGCNRSENAKEATTGEAGQAAEQAGITYELLPSKSELEWRGTKPTGEHHGTVDFKEGAVSVQEGEITSGKFIIDLTSIKNEDLTDEESRAKLVGHLKSEDFFHVDEHPEAIFEVVKIEKAGETAEGNPEMNITGNLTMRGITKSITIPAQIEVEDDHIIAQTEEFSIDRTLWNVNYQSKKVFDNLKDKYIDDAINLRLELYFQKAEGKSA